MLLFITSCDPVLDTPAVNACFERNVLPLVERDCSFCHFRGEYGVKLKGRQGDFQELMRYSLPYDSSGSPFLAWASGAYMHPIIWPEDSDEYKTVASWIDTGMKRDCFDMTFFGDCRFNSDCLLVTCICPDFSMPMGQVCYKDSNTSKGTCARNENCADPKFGICKAGVDDGGVDDGGMDAGPDGYDAGGDQPDSGDTGYDGGYDGGADDGPQVSFSQNIVPLLYRDCRRCHSRGEYNVKITGTTSDYPEVMRYVDANDPEGYNSFLWWAAGGARHPVSWPKGGSQYNLFLTWVQEGARNN